MRFISPNPTRREIRSTRQQLRAAQKGRGGKSKAGGSGGESKAGSNSGVVGGGVEGVASKAALEEFLNASCIVGVGSFLDYPSLLSGAQCR
jgi:hypothetical protein